MRGCRLILSSGLDCSITFIFFNEEETSCIYISIKNIKILRLTAYQTKLTFDTAPTHITASNIKVILFVIDKFSREKRISQNCQ